MAESHVQSFAMFTCKNVLVLTKKQRKQHQHEAFAICIMTDLNHKTHYSAANVSVYTYLSINTVWQISVSKFLKISLHLINVSVNPFPNCSFLLTTRNLSFKKINLIMKEPTLILLVT